MIGQAHQTCRRRRARGGGGWTDSTQRGALSRGGATSRPAGHDKRKRQSKAKQVAQAGRVVSSERPRAEKTAAAGRVMGRCGLMSFPLPLLKVWMVHAPVRFRLAYYGRARPFSFGHGSGMRYFACIASEYYCSTYNSHMNQFK